VTSRGSIRPPLTTTRIRQSRTRESRLRSVGGGIANIYFAGPRPPQPAAAVATAAYRIFLPRRADIDKNRSERLRARCYCRGRVFVQTVFSPRVHSSNQYFRRVSITTRPRRFQCVFGLHGRQVGLTSNFSFFKIVFGRCDFSRRACHSRRRITCIIGIGFADCVRTSHTRTHKVFAYTCRLMLVTLKRHII